MTNPDNVGGLPTADQLYDIAADAWDQHQTNCRVTTTAGSLRKAVEAIHRKLCRAAPAGGDVAKGDWNDWFETWAKARGMTMQQTADGRFLCPDTSLAQKAHEAGCMVSHMYYLELCRQEELAKSAPAGSGEVEEVARQMEAMAEHIHACSPEQKSERLRGWASMLRALSRGVPEGNAVIPWRDEIDRMYVEGWAQSLRRIKDYRAYFIEHGYHPEYVAVRLERLLAAIAAQRKEGE